MEGKILQNKVEIYEKVVHNIYKKSYTQDIVDNVYNYN